LPHIQTLASRCSFFIWWCDERHDPPHHLGLVWRRRYWLFFGFRVGLLCSALVFLSALRFGVPVGLLGSRGGGDRSGFGQIYGF
ncbi:hypothetical protein A2U01_0082379, partial [Trifolium medium]|nr:hypothetical protein [Trifolium medium]